MSLLQNPRLAPGAIEIQPLRGLPQVFLSSLKKTWGTFKNLNPKGVERE